jgi:hypothetical protein
LDTIRRSISSTTKVRDPWHFPRGRSELVRIFLWKNDVDSAWHEAEEGGCSNDLWLPLAAKRKKNHPADALHVYLDKSSPRSGPALVTMVDRSDFRKSGAIDSTARPTSAP